MNDVHTCPPRRDNKLVTARRIAEKYEKMIIANPTWSLEAMKTTVQEDMFADVHISKLKRAKSIVMQRAFDATKDQYKRLYNYQLELLRSNPGSAVVIRSDQRVFQRMYICLDALKKGFIAGCRMYLCPKPAVVSLSMWPLERHKQKLEPKNLPGRSFK